MFTFRRILVAIKDPWARSLPGLQKAAQLARALDARLQLFHGMTDPVYFQVGEVHKDDLASDTERSRRARVLRRLQTLAHRFDRSSLAADVAVEWDYPAHEAVIRAARRFNADLVVAERHITVHRLPWLLRFTDFELLRLAPMPVLLVKTRTRYRQPRILAAVDPGHAHSKLTQLDRGILRCGSALAGALRGKLYAVYAFDPLPFVGTATEVPFGEAAEVLETVTEARARKALDRILSRIEVPQSRRCLVPRHPSDAIDSTAREIGSSIVVMGALSRSGLKRLVIGNTAERVLDLLPCDVLIVKPRGFASRIPREPRGPELIALPEFRE